MKRTSEKTAVVLATISHSLSQGTNFHWSLIRNKNEDSNQQTALKQKLTQAMFM